MSADKADRLAAIRAANRQKVAATTSSDTSSPPEPKSSAAGGAHRSNIWLSRGLSALLALLFAVVSGLLIIAMIDIWPPILHYALPNLGAGLSESWQSVGYALPALAPSMYLSLSRASALVGYGLLWLSMALGLAITSRATRIWPGGPAAADLHQYLSLLGLLFASFHVIILLGDPMLDYTLAKALLPFFGSSYRPLWVGMLGKAALYLMAIVSLSFYLRARIGARWWRRIHYLSFAVFLLTLLHGILAGTDTPTLWAQALYGISGVSLLGLLIYRIVRTRRTQSSDVAQLQVGALTLDPISRTVTRADARKVTLRTIEARLLYYLMQNAGQVLAVDQILISVWGRHYKGKSKLVASYMRRLRAKIEPNPAAPVHLLSVPEQRYQLEGHPAQSAA